MDPISIISGILGVIAALGPEIRKAIVGDRTDEQVIADARAAVDAIPDGPAKAAIDALRARRGGG